MASYETFIATVSRECGEAEEVVVAAVDEFFEQVGERMDNEEAEMLAGDLPEELGSSLLRGRLMRDHPHETFYEVVGHTLRGDHDHTVAIWYACQECLSEHELLQLKLALPPSAQHLLA